MFGVKRAAGTATQSCPPTRLFSMPDYLGEPWKWDWTLCIFDRYVVSTKSMPYRGFLVIYSANE
jgi:hypothetical protein